MKYKSSSEVMVSLGVLFQPVQSKTRAVVTCDSLARHLCFSLNISVIRQCVLSDLMKSVNGSHRDSGDSVVITPRRLPSHQQLVKIIHVVYYCVLKATEMCMHQ